MTRALQLSIAGNVLLAATCSFLFFWNQQHPVASDSTLERSAPTPKSPAFDWKQPRSRDLPAFIASPDATVRDIVTGGVADKKERRLTAASTSSRSTAQIQAGRDRTIASPLEPTSLGGAAPALDASPADASSVTSGVNETPGITATAMVQPVRAPTYPAVFAHNAAAAAAAQAQTSANGTTGTAPQATAEEQLMLEKISNDFVSAVGGTDQDPNDPAYQLRWGAAQELSDAQYKKFFGGRAYVRRQIEAAQQAVVEQQAAAQK